MKMAREKGEKGGRSQGRTSPGPWKEGLPPDQLRSKVFSKLFNFLKPHVSSRGTLLSIAIPRLHPSPNESEWRRRVDENLHW